MSGSFLKKIHGTKKVKDIRTKINQNKRKAKQLARLYKTTVKQVAKRIASSIKLQKSLNEKRKKRNAKKKNSASYSK
jgi:hypothetical protein